MVFCWGATLCGMAAAKDFGGLMATRFVLGSFEASVAPTFIALVQMWYRRSEQTNRNAAWYSMLGIVNIVSATNFYSMIVLKADFGTVWQSFELRPCAHSFERAVSISGKADKI